MNVSSHQQPAASSQQPAASSQQPAASSQQQIDCRAIDANSHGFLSLRADLLRWARRRTRSRTYAEDVADEVLVQGWCRFGVEVVAAAGRRWCARATISLAAGMFRRRALESGMTERFWAQVPTREDSVGALLQELCQNPPTLTKPEAETLTMLVGGESTSGIARLRRVGERSVQLALAAIRRKARVWRFS